MLSAAHGRGHAPRLSRLCQSRIAEADEVVVAQLLAKAGKVAVGHGVEDAAMPLDRVIKPDTLALDLRPHERAHLAVKHAPQILEPAPAGHSDDQLVKLGVAGD